ncbi:hypothetical protein KL932_000995 [Ogataea haglerorum]|nr:hypothetical protein KL932_000995 [Ogataea haglerorum]
MKVASELTDERVFARLKAYNSSGEGSESEYVYVNGKPITCRRCKRKRLVSETPEQLQFKTCNPCRVIERAQKRRGAKNSVIKNREEYDMIQQIRGLDTDLETAAVADAPRTKSEKPLEMTPDVPQSSTASPSEQPDGLGLEKDSLVEHDTTTQSRADAKAELQQRLVSLRQGDLGHATGEQDPRRPASVCVCCGQNTNGLDDLCSPCENRDSVIKSLDYYLELLQLNHEQELSNIVFTTNEPHTQLLARTPAKELTPATLLLRLYEKYILAISKATGYDFKYQTESEFSRKCCDPVQMKVRECLKCVNEIDMLFQNDDIDSELMALQSSPVDQTPAKTPCHSLIFVSYNARSGRLVISFTHQPHR